MKIFAIGSLTRQLSDEEREALLRSEVPHTLRMYLDGPIEQFWFRQDRPGPIFLMEVGSIEEAKAAVEAMPIVAAGVASYDFIPVGPLAPLGRLIAGLSTVSAWGPDPSRDPLRRSRGARLTRAPRGLADVSAWA